MLCVCLSDAGQPDGVEVVWLASGGCRQRPRRRRGSTRQQDGQGSQGQELEGFQGRHGKGASSANTYNRNIVARPNVVLVKRRIY